MKKLLALVTCLIFSASLPATALSNDEMKIGISQEFENFNPLIMNMLATTYMYNLVGRGLVTLNPDGKWVPVLAKSIPTLENGGAKLTTVNGKKTIVAKWDINEKAKWSDGKPVVCADFKLTRDIAASNNVSVGEKETFTLVEKVEWDEKTPQKCTFTYDKARWDFYQIGRLYPLPSHLEKSVFEQFGSQKEGYEKNTNYAKNPTLDGLYNGPYKISEVRLGSHVTFVPNPHFYGPAPKIKKIVVKLIPNTGTMEANLRSGTIDTISSLGLSFDQALAFEKKVKAENLPFRVEFKPSLTYEHIDLNLDNPILKDIRVRKALVYAINREDLTKALFEGRQIPALHSVAPIDPWFTKDPNKIVIYNYNRKEAARLLDEAGWKLNEKDGFRYKDGKKLSLQFMTTAGNKTRETVQTYLQSQWKASGIEIVIKNEPARVFFGETLKKRKFEALAMFAWISSPENSPKSTFHSKNIPSDKNGWSGQNNMGWVNAKVDKALEQLEGEFNHKKRVELVHQILKEYTNEVPVIPLYYRADIAVPPLALKNFELSGHQFSETTQAEKWEIVK
jgi:peptide/nickel transport system substrate-binding protein